MELICPSCHQALAEPEEGKPCTHCGASYRLAACCPECRKPLEVLKACGAVDYFCQHGHGLVSKKSVLWLAVAED
ncbi:hypothetical protein TUM12370_09850 [Salmonella enterica subsp. enterica serovar Choleraesuis]|nr:hypothetical protein TUM12370_09850 [Salmonella enterica subsp. enterica serovar Choleraesuis]